MILSFAGGFLVFCNWSCFWSTGAVASSAVKQKLQEVILKKQKQAALERTHPNALNAHPVPYRWLDLKLNRKRSHRFDLNLFFVLHFLSQTFFAQKKLLKLSQYKKDTSFKVWGNTLAGNRNDRSRSVSKIITHSQQILQYSLFNKYEFLQHFEVFSLFFAAFLTRVMSGLGLSSDNHLNLFFSKDFVCYW